MKKIILFSVFILPIFGFAQTRHEVKLNILNTIVHASVEVGYEYFTSSSSSIGLDVLINDRFSYYPEDPDEGKEFNTNSVQLSYNFYFSEGQGYYVSPFVKYRFGDFEEMDKGVKTVTDMDSFILGLGVGYEWVWNDQFAFGPYANIARNFSEEVNDEFASIELNGGIWIGYRF